MGIEQINMAIAQMDQVTQQNAALVEEAAAAAGSLEDQAATLARVVSVFNVGEVHGRRPAKAPAVPIRPTAKQASSKPRRLAVANGADNWEDF